MKDAILKPDFARNRFDQLFYELNYAIEHTPREEIQKWAFESIKLYGRVLVRRVSGLLKATSCLFWDGISELTAGIAAVQKKKFIKHAKNVGQKMGRSITEKGEELTLFIKDVIRELEKNPVKMAPKFLAGFLGFTLGSGGLDGNGGAPDLDLKLGLGYHRSIFSHSILFGAFCEVGVFSLVILVDKIYKNLPSDHDVFWTRVYNGYRELSVAFVQGLCGGIAYHLLIDSTLDSGKAYVHLPFSTTMSMHQGIMFTNALAEGLDVTKKELPSGVEKNG